MASVLEGRTIADWAGFNAAANSCFMTRCAFEPMAADAELPDLSFVEGSGVSVSTAVMPALRLTNHGSARLGPYYHITRVDQKSVFLAKGREPIRLDPCELVILRPGTTGEWTVERDYTMSVLQVDEGLFNHYIADPMSLVAQKLSLHPELAKVMGHIMDAALAVASNGRFNETGRNLACSLLSILAVGRDGGALDERAERDAIGYRRSQIKRYIDVNHAQFDLTTEEIASHFKISPRYVQMALATEGLTPSQYLMLRRLEEAKRLLGSTAFSGRSITEIAYDCGFANSAHFSTEFKKRFGKTPRDYRSFVWRNR